jgi:H+/Cl- antiporter ClcA
VAEILLRANRKVMRHLLVGALKAAGIALVYGALGYMLCRAVKVCLWGPFLLWHGGDNVDAWSLFNDYFYIFLQSLTALIAFLAGRSYRPFFQVGGVTAGTVAVLIFRLYEREQWVRRESVDYTFFEVAFLGVVFGLLGSVSGRFGLPVAKAKSQYAA